MFPLSKVPSPSKSDLRALFDQEPQARKIGLIFEREGSLGQKVILDLSKKRRQMPVYRIDMNEQEVDGWGEMTGPTLVIVSREGEVVQRVGGSGGPEDRAKFRNALRCEVGWVNTVLPPATLEEDDYVSSPPVNRPDLVSGLFNQLKLYKVSSRSTNLTSRLPSVAASIMRSLPKIWTRKSLGLSASTSRLSSTFCPT